MNKISFFSLLGIILCLFSCNPECETIIVTITPKISAETHEILLSSPVPATLLDKRVLIGEVEVKNMRFVENRGLVVQIPEGVTSESPTIKIQDLDCGNVTAINDFRVSDVDNLFNTSEFIFPSTPVFIIPVTPPNLPPSIDNAWVSPVNDDYCLWFKTKKEFIYDDNGNIIQTKELPILDSEFSREQSICSQTLNNESCPDKLYCKNSISGIVDKENNYIDITIHRSEHNTGLPDESFTGQFIDINNAQFPVNKSMFHQGCLSSAKPDFTLLGHLMLLTSKTTGRQLLITQPCLKEGDDSPECN